MGQKTHPLGFRLGVTRTWDSLWYAERDYKELLAEDLMIRRYVFRRMERASISKVSIERAPRRVTVNIHTARPGVIIGRKGAEVDRLRDELKHVTGKEIYINIVEVKVPEIDAQLVAESIARQITQRVSSRRAMKRAIASAMRMGAEGIRVAVGGRLGGSDMARHEHYREGRVPLHTLRADIDFAKSTAQTTHGCVGVKVWIHRGEFREDEATGYEKSEQKHAPDTGRERPVRAERPLPGDTQLAPGEDG
ncbi:MAG: 30S ribosomal protein S3 [Candidatus Eisenbacteria bacterium]|nr:30S ribosomal protein S3 [Candidatus Eisenbacteria bacterium]